MMITFIKAVRPQYDTSFSLNKTRNKQPFPNKGAPYQPRACGSCGLSISVAPSLSSLASGTSSNEPKCASLATSARSSSQLRYTISWGARRGAFPPNLLSQERSKDFSFAANCLGESHWQAWTTLPALLPSRSHPHPRVNSMSGQARQPTYRTYTLHTEHPTAQAPA